MASEQQKFNLNSVVSRHEHFDDDEPQIPMSYLPADHEYIQVKIRNVGGKILRSQVDWKAHLSSAYCLSYFEKLNDLVSEPWFLLKDGGDTHLTGSED